MLKKNPFLKYVMKSKKEDIFHSSGFARSQSGSNLGAASSETHAARRAKQENRQFIQGYNRSSVGGSFNPTPRAQTYTPPSSAPSSPSSTTPGSRPIPNSRPTPNPRPASSPSRPTPPPARSTPPPRPKAF